MALRTFRRIVAIPAPNEMGPDREPLIGNISIERVEVAMERALMSSRSAVSDDTPANATMTMVSGLERDCRLVDVPHVGDKSLWREFA